MTQKDSGLESTEHMLKYKCEWKSTSSTIAQVEHYGSKHQKMQVTYLLTLKRR